MAPNKTAQTCEAGGAAWVVQHQACSRVPKMLHRTCRPLTARCSTALNTAAPHRRKVLCNYMMLCRYLTAAALLAATPEQPVASQQLLRLLACAPAKQLRPQVAKLAVFAWTWVLTAASPQQSVSPVDRHQLSPRLQNAHCTPMLTPSRCCVPTTAIYALSRWLRLDTSQRPGCRQQKHASACSMTNLIQRRFSRRVGATLRGCRRSALSERRRLMWWRASKPTMCGCASCRRSGR